jgi:23S rRNA pseudouridine955/2504/2580 synthase
LIDLPEHRGSGALVFVNTNNLLRRLFVAASAIIPQMLENSKSKSPQTPQAPVQSTQQTSVTVVPEQVNWITLPEDADGQRLDNFLFKILKGVPKSHIYRLMRDGEIRIDKKRVDQSDRIEAGKILRVPPIRLAPAAEAVNHAHVPDFNHPIIYEDAHLLVINKPSGLAVHGGSGVSYGLIEQIRLSRPAGAFYELVHRLDRETSGIICVAKTRKALVKFHEQLRQGQTDKRYLCLVVGRFRNDRMHVKTPLTKYLLPSGERRVRPDAAGQQAHTIFNVLERRGEMSLLEAELKTGRTHQIRVHLMSENFPIAGDDKYGDYDWNKAAQKLKPKLTRMFLHAHQFSFDHPVTGEPMVIQCPLSPELEVFWAGQVSEKPATIDDFINDE